MNIVGTSKVLGLLYDTFPFSKINHKEAKSIFETAKKELLLMEISENIN